MYFFYVCTTLELLLERVGKPTVFVATCGWMDVYGGAPPIFLEKLEAVALP
jgi:hypothetical protein